MEEIVEPNNNTVEEATTPVWLTEEFVEGVLRREERSEKELSVVHRHVQAAVAKGDNFGSLLNRVTVELRRVKNGGHETERRCLIVKSLPSGDWYRDILVKAGVFTRELRVYQVTLPAMYNLLGATTPTLTARSFYSARPDTLVLEDLRPLGYKMADRRQQLGLEHCAVALQALGKFHALSIALHNQDPSSMDHFQEGFYTEERREIFRPFLQPALESLASAVEKWPNFERFGDKLRNVAATAVDRIIEVVKPSKNSLSVLNHGDFWINNILFKYHPTKNKVIGVRFVDFQVSRFSSPALDLQYFLYTSVREEVRSQWYSYLIKEYHVSLGRTLEELGCSDMLVSFAELEREMRARAFFGFVTACTYLGSVLADPSEVVDLDSNLHEESQKNGGQNPMEKAYAGARFRRIFQKLLIHFENNGLL